MERQHKDLEEGWAGLKERTEVKERKTGRSEKRGGKREESRKQQLMTLRLLSLGFLTSCNYSANTHTRTHNVDQPKSLYPQLSTCN